MTDEAIKPLNDRQRAFKRYKEGVAKDGKPFFPHGVYHDIIAVIIMLAIIIGLSVVWFAQANCDSWWNVSCKHAATPLEQKQYTPGHTGVTKWETKAGGVVVVKQGAKPPAGATPVEGARHPLLGALYEEQADPATTQYHPRPEWYFYFLFYLLIVFANPYLVVFGTIIIPTVFLVMLIALPFVDRKKERRPSRRPVAMTLMVGTAITLLVFTYNGSKSGKETGPEGISAAQQKLPGYDIIFKGKAKGVCTGCHMIGGQGGNVGPSLVAEGKVVGHDTLDWQIAHLDNPQSKSPGSSMPPRPGGLDDREVAQVAAFMLTLGNDARAKDADITSADEGTTAGILGGNDKSATMKPGAKETANNTTSTTSTQSGSTSPK
ncbi:MAG: c-type cytochrome [Thermoleophilia bacterium]|nr:c-type cytochrome [Thermoleophilia bacterium]